MRAPALLLVVSLVLAACSGESEGPQESSADDVPPRTPTTTAPPPPTAERVAADAVTLGGPGDQRITGLVAGADRVVAVGSDGNRPAVWSSGDGERWERHDLGSGAFPAGSAISSVSLAGPGFIAAGHVRGRGALWTSPDGRRWRAADVDDGPPVHAVGATGIGLVAVAGGQRAAAWYSDDGTLWLRAPDDELFERPGRVRPAAVISGGPGGLVLVQREGAGAELWATPDGVAWTEAPASGAQLLTSDGTPVPLAVATAGDRIIAGGSVMRPDGIDAAIWSSTAARSWEPAPHREAVFGGDGVQQVGGITIVGEGAMAAGTTAAAGGDDLVLWDSPDGTRWRATVIEAPGRQQVTGMASIDEMVIAAGWESGADGDDAVIWRVVPDRGEPEQREEGGLLWVRVREQRALEGPGTQRLTGVALVGSEVVAVGAASDPDGEGTDAAVWRSDDGGSWERVRSPSLEGPGDQELTAVAARGEGAIAVGRDGDRAAAWVSPDGRRWQRAGGDEPSFAGARPSVASGVAVHPDGTVVAVGRAGSGAGSRPSAWRSVDGLRWEAAPGLATGPGAINDVTQAAGTFTATGSVDGLAVVWQSTDGLAWQRTDLGPGEAHAAAVPESEDGPVAVVVAGAAPEGDGDASVWLRLADGWRRVPEGLGRPFAQAALGLAVAPSGMTVAVGQTHDGVGLDAAGWSASDGLAWQANPHDEDELGGDQTQRMVGVVVRDDLVVAVGSSGDDDVDGAVWVAHLAGGGGASSPL